MAAVSYTHLILSRDCFEVKVSQSVISDSYVFPYYICITPNVGGIERSQLFDIIDTGSIVLGKMCIRDRSNGLLGYRIIFRSSLNP